MPLRTLILAGTSEARELAERLAADARFEVTLSLAGRTAQLPPQPVPHRVGGFGGAEGLAEHLRSRQVGALIDATHPFAAEISRNALAAARAAGTPFLALRRAGWAPRAGDRWLELDGVEEAVRALGPEPRRVFLALGRKQIEPFARAPQHFYLVRSVDPVSLPLPRAEYVLQRGPFREAQELALLEKHGIDVLVCRNSGGAAAVAKLDAARALGLPVLLLRRPQLPDAPCAATPGEALAWLAHLARGAAERGV